MELQSRERWKHKEIRRWLRSSKRNKHSPESWTWRRMPACWWGFGSVAVGGQPCSESQSVPKTWACPSTRPLNLAALPLGYRLPINPVNLFGHLHRQWRKHTFYFHLKYRSPTALWMISCMWVMKKLQTSASLSHVSSLLYMLATCQITMTAPLVWVSVGRKRSKCLEQQKPPMVWMQWSFSAVYFTQSCKPHTFFDIGGVNYCHLCSKYHIAFPKTSSAVYTKNNPMWPLQTYLTKNL